MTKILDTARNENADMIGLSGLITPSLDEMCLVASEMERQGFDLPLLIGGATTSRVHTAVKIHPNYQRCQAVHVNDASRAVAVAGQLMSQEARGGYVRQVRDAHHLGIQLGDDFLRRAGRRDDAIPRDRFKAGYARFGDRLSVRQYRRTR